MIDALTERQIEAVELILAVAAASPAMADEATQEAMEFARPLLETAPALSAFVAQLGRQFARAGCRAWFGPPPGKVESPDGAWVPPWPLPRPGKG